MTNKYNYFLVEGGETLRLCKDHIANVHKTNEQNVKLAKELGVEQYFTSFDKGTITGVIFNGALHPDFKVPSRRSGACFPRKGSDWEKRFAECEGYDRRGFILAEKLGVPTNIRYTFDGGHGSSVVSHSFDAGVGFLWLSDDGPFALYVVDVADRVFELEATGRVVDSAVKNWKPSFDGVRPILKEEWKLLVAQHDLAEASAAA